MFGMTLQGMAQKVDLNNVKFIVVTMDGVNLRKAPSTNSAKLMCETMIVSEEEDGTETLAYPVWSDTRCKQGYKRSVCQPYKGQILPFVGDVDGWYKAMYHMEMEGTTEVYISKQFCREVPKQDITVNTSFSSYGSITIIKSGSYKNYFVLDNSDPENGEEMIIGHLVNGMIVFDGCSTDNYWEVENTDLQKLTTAQYNTLFKKRTPALVMYQASDNFGFFALEPTNK